MKKITTTITLSLAMLLLPYLTAMAQTPTIEVNTTTFDDENDTNGDITITEAINYAANNDGTTITFNISGENLVIEVNDAPTISNLNITIDGKNRATGNSNNITLTPTTEHFDYAFSIEEMNENGPHTVTIKNINFESFNGAALELQPGHFDNSQLTVNIENCVFKNNTNTDDGGGGNGGAVTNQSPMLCINIENCTFLNNNTTSTGGALSLNSNTASIKNCTFVNNTTAVNDTTASSSTASSGTAINFVGSDSLLLFNNIFIGDGTDNSVIHSDKPTKAICNVFSMDSATVAGLGDFNNNGNVYGADSASVFSMTGGNIDRESDGVTLKVKPDGVAVTHGFKAGAQSGENTTTVKDETSHTMSYDYGTLCYPTDISLTNNTDIEAYELSSITSGTTRYTQGTSVNTITANKPVLIKKKSGSGGYTLPACRYIPSSTYYNDEYGILYGHYNSAGITTVAGNYVLQNHDGDGLAFYRVGSGASDPKPTIPQFRCYLNVPGGDQSPAIRLFGDGDATGIDDIVLSPACNRGNTVHDLMGREVKTPVKGHIYVVNGKKVVY